MRPQCPGGSTANFSKRMGEGVYMESSRETTFHKCHKTESCNNAVNTVTEKKKRCGKVIHF